MTIYRQTAGNLYNGIRLCRPFTDGNGTIIDLLIDREVINLCEIKYCADKYVITADYDERLRNSQLLLRKVTKTNKALYHIFITTYGVAHNLHDGIVQLEVTMDVLFE